MVIAQPVEDQLELSSGRGDCTDVAVAAAMRHLFSDRADVTGLRIFTDSIAAHRTRREPCLVMCPR
jgi:hypothetical protein